MQKQLFNCQKDLPLFFTMEDNHTAACKDVDGLFKALNVT